MSRYSDDELAELHDALNDPALHLRATEGWFVARTLLEEVEWWRLVGQHGQYTSTACVHNHHGNCTVNCDYCGRLCRCDCHAWNAIDEEIKGE